MTLEKLATTDREGAVRTIEKLMDLFGVTEIKVKFGCPECAELYGCYFASQNLICFNPDRNERLPVFTVVHEFGHALHYHYTGYREGITYAEGEGFARRLESIYLLSKGEMLDFKCPCARTLLRLMPDGDLCCQSCGGCYYTELYPQRFVY